MVSLTRTNGRARLQHVQQETGTCDGSVRAGVVEVRAGMVAGLIEAVPASQGRMTGLEGGIMGVIQVRDDDDARPDGTGPDVIGMGMFWMPEKDNCCPPFSNAVEPEPEG
jgi:hypothetical protein